MGNPYLLKFAGAMEQQGQSLDGLLGKAFFTPSDQLAPTSQNQQVSPQGGVAPQPNQQMTPLDAGGIPDVYVDGRMVPSDQGGMGTNGDVGSSILPPPQQGGQGDGGQPSQGQYGALSQYADIYAKIEQDKGLPPGTLMHFAGLESSYGKNLHNPNSSATGPFQIIDSTRKGLGMSYEDVMDPVRSAMGAADLAVDAQPMLRKALGRDPTKEELYLAHQQGLGGSKALLENPNMNVVDALSTVMSRDKAIQHVRLNGGSLSMTAADFSNMWTNKNPDGSPPTSYNAQRDSATYGDISPRRGDRDPSRVDELSQAQIEEIDAEIEEETLSPEDKQKQYRGMLLMAIGKGLSQMSAGQDVDIMSVVQSYHDRQDAYKKRLREMQKEKRSILQRVQERGYQVEDQEDLQAHELRKQEVENRAQMEQQIAQQAHDSAEKVLDRNLEEELQNGRITNEQYLQDRSLKFSLLMQLDDQAFREKYAKNRYDETYEQARLGREFTGRESMLDRLQRDRLQEQSQKWQSGENTLDRSQKDRLQTQELGVRQYENQQERDLQLKMQKIGLKATRDENASDRALRAKLQSEQIASTEGMHATDIAEARQAAEDARKFADEQRSATERFTLSRDSSLFDHEKLMQNDRFKQEYDVLHDTQKFTAKQNALQRVFTMGQNRERMDFDKASAEELRAYEMGKEGRQNDFMKSMEELRNQHIIARDKTLADYAKDVVEDERDYQDKLRGQVGEALGEAIQPMLTDFSEDEKASFLAGMKVTPESTYNMVVNAQKMRKEEKEKELELNNRKELAETLKNGKASDTTINLALQGKTGDAMARYAIEHGEDAVKFEDFQKMTADEQIQYLRLKSSGSNVDPLLAKQLELNGDVYKDVAEKAKVANAVSEQAKAMMDIMNRNPSGRQGVWQAKTLGLRKIAADLGFNTGEGITDQTLFNALAARSAQLSHIPGLGSQSDYEAAQAVTATPGLDKTPGANRLLLQLQIGQAERLEAKRLAIEEFMGTGGGTPEQREAHINRKMSDLGLNQPIVQTVEGGLGAVIDNLPRLKTGDAFAVREGDKTNYYFSATNPNGELVIYDVNGRMVEGAKLGL